MRGFCAGTKFRAYGKGAVWLVFSRRAETFFPQTWAFFPADLDLFTLRPGLFSRRPGRSPSRAPGLPGGAPGHWQRATGDIWVPAGPRPGES